jgi:hypothetical protein
MLKFLTASSAKRNYKGNIGAALNQNKSSGHELAVKAA